MLTAREQFFVTLPVGWLPSWVLYFMFLCGLYGWLSTAFGDCEE
jgi:hypothetical protein